jgi:protoheme IX farnesyltransferase
MDPVTAELDLADLDAPIVSARVVDYYELTKPRMNALVVITTAVGFYLGSRGWDDWKLLLHTVLGTALTAAGASILNQYVERDLDARMPRTANRPLPAGRISPIEALTLGVIFSMAGVLYLVAMVNPLAAMLATVTLGTYVFLYTPLKTRTSMCTVVGAIPGAIPPMIGFAAAQGELSPAAWALFSILFIWQLPHFLAIAILYRDDYAQGGMLMLPVLDERLSLTGRQIVLWSLALIPVSLFPSVVGLTGLAYFITATVLGVLMLFCGVRCAITRRRVDARRLFFASIIYLPALLGAMMVTKLS